VRFGSGSAERPSTDPIDWSDAGYYNVVFSTGETVRLCRAASATGKLVADAQHAALAMSEGCTWVTRDGDFARFEPHGLRWRHLVLE